MTEQSLAIVGSAEWALLQWLDEMAAQGILTTDNDARHPQLEPVARNAHRLQRRGDDRPSTAHELFRIS